MYYILRYVAFIHYLFDVQENRLVTSVALEGKVIGDFSVTKTEGGRCKSVDDVCVNGGVVLCKIK